MGMTITGKHLKKENVADNHAPRASLRQLPPNHASVRHGSPDIHWLAQRPFRYCFIGSPGADRSLMTLRVPTRCMTIATTSGIMKKLMAGHCRSANSLEAGGGRPQRKHLDQPSTSSCSFVFYLT